MKPDDGVAGELGEIGDDHGVAAGADDDDRVVPGGITGALCASPRRRCDLAAGDGCGFAPL